MKKLKKHICLRITDAQFRKLTNVLVDERMSKSELIRTIIHNYLEDRYDKTEGQNKK